jgi:hypothetical protein
MENNIKPEEILKKVETWKELQELVYNTAKMREHQKKFFKSREPSELREAKKFEKLVDVNLSRLWPVEAQQKLF